VPASSPVKDLRASLIVSTYDNPHALGLVLAGVGRQTIRAFELLVADDGSTDDTRRVVEAFAATADFPVHHLWQPDEGIRKCRILNRALLAATGAYAIFLDGDCIPPPDLVAGHLALSRRGRYLSGGKLLLGPRPSRSLTPEHVRSGALDRIFFGSRDTRRLRRAVARRVPGLAELLDRVFVRRPVGFHGENSSLYVCEARAVGGFDERFARFEDKDFGRRLRASGLHAESVRYRIPVWHVDHGRSYVGRDTRSAARALYEENARTGAIVTQYGIACVRDEEKRILEVRPKSIQAPS
jgi:glycosyltransferase involved in cell wall biosynthesis